MVFDKGSAILSGLSVERHASGALDIETRPSLEGRKIVCDNLPAVR